jgi:hypothetical protein
MKKLVFFLGALLCPNFLFSNMQKDINSEFTINFEYGTFPQKLFSLERHEKYEEGVWLSYRIFQKEEVINHQIFSIKISLLTPIISKYLYNGIEIGFGIPTKVYTEKYVVPALTSDLAGAISLPFSFSIEQRYSQEIKNEIEIYLLPILYKIELRFPLGEKTKFSAGVGMGPKFIIENNKNLTINTYIEDFYLYKKGEATTSINKKSNFYLVPYIESLIGLNFLVSSRIYFGINAKLGYIISSDYANEETDFQQIEWWPEEKELIKLKSGNLFEGINFTFGIELKIFI